MRPTARQIAEQDIGPATVRRTEIVHVTAPVNLPWDIDRDHNAGTFTARSVIVTWSRMGDEPWRFRGEVHGPGPLDVVVWPEGGAPEWLNIHAAAYRPEATS